MDDEFMVKVDIIGRKFRMWIARKDEGFVRDVAKQINMKYNRYKNKYTKDAGEIDWLAMTAYTLSKELLQASDRNDTAPYEDKIRQITALLEQYLNEHND
ncbi:MAG: cell division protein ZapA [Tannerellaceae bacterium]|jgi:cell division protein ZapA|nr:cell division protein ZapA [Tannerellaceae bacterium]